MPAFYPEGDEPKLADPSGRSLHKINNLLKSIEAKTGSATITGAVTVNNEVEIKNTENNPIPVSDNGGSLTVDGTVTVNDMTSGNAKTKIVDSTGADVSYIPAGTAGTPSSSVLSVQGINGGVSLPISGTVTADVTTGSLQSALESFGANYNQAVPVAIDQTGFGSVPVVDSNLGATTDSVATTDTGTFSVIALIKRGLQNWTSLLAKIPALVSGRIPVDGSGVTQPTRETQPIGDYVINTSAFANFSPVGSVLTSSAFDAGANADYVVITLEGGGSSGAFSFDLSVLNTGLWDPGSGGFFNVYYDIPATSATDTYSYRNVNSPTLFGSTRAAFNGRFIIPLTQNTPYAGTSTTYRYIRLNCPASYGGWRYRFTSYKSVNSLLSASVPGNPSTTRVTGRVDVGYITGGSVSISGTTSVSDKGSTGPTTVTTFTSTSSLVLMPSNSARKLLAVFNEGVGTLYVLYGAGTASTSNYSVRLNSGDYLEVEKYTGAVTGIFGTAGTARVTEVS